MSREKPPDKRKPPMPNLPTIEVTQAQADRIIAAYGAVTTYQGWLRQAVRQYVGNIETVRIRQAANDQIEAIQRKADEDVESKMKEIEDTLK